MKYTFNVAFLTMMTLFCGTLRAMEADSLVIQENSLGVCTMDGVVEDSQPGYTWEGYANIDDGTGIGMSWSIGALNAGSYKVSWRFALGGSDATSRDAKLFVNNVLVDTIIFRHSDSQSWAEWKMTDAAAITLDSGFNTVRLVSVTPKGLANLDYIVLYGKGLSPAACWPSYVFTVTPCHPSYGSVSFTPVQEFYDAGTEITVIADASSGYFFHSWSGEEASVLDTFTFSISRNTHLTALFYADGTLQAEGASGYATVQHDNGTPYLLTGGICGDTVQPETLEELEGYLGAEEPLVILVSKHFTGDGEISFNSDKTLIGTNDTAHIQGVMMSLAGVRNIIIRNITFSRVITMDEMEINGAKNIWIDRCEFFTDRDHDKDYYDGLLDIKNESSFITVSRSHFHDHFKSILISSGDDSDQDSVQRITFHHNYFHECGSRLPSIRFGKAHVFSNLYENNGSAIHTRVGACVKIEHNYFLNNGTAVMQSLEGSIDLDSLSNVFINSSVQAGIGTCALDVPYVYEHLIDSAAALPSMIPDLVREVSMATSSFHLQEEIPEGISVHPNPCKDFINVTYRLESATPVTIRIFSMDGRFSKDLVNHEWFVQGEHHQLFSLDQVPPGIYILRMESAERICNGKLIKL